MTTGPPTTSNAEQTDEDDFAREVFELVELGLVAVTGPSEDPRFTLTRMGEWEAVFLADAEQDLRDEARELQQRRHAAATSGTVTFLGEWLSGRSVPL